MLSFSTLYTHYAFSCVLVTKLNHIFLLQAKLDLLNKIDTFRSEVDLAGEAISQKAAEKISDNDVIMVYGW